MSEIKFDKMLYINGEYTYKEVILVDYFNYDGTISSKAEKIENNGDLIECSSLGDVYFYVDKYYILVS